MLDDQCIMCTFLERLFVRELKGKGKEMCSLRMDYDKNNVHSNDDSLSVSVFSQICDYRKQISESLKVRRK